jgi:peptidoglycan/LPS O-acetylase OafA/YrhL
MIESLAVVFSSVPVIGILAASFYIFAVVMLLKGPRAYVSSFLTAGPATGHIPVADVLRGLAALWVALMHMITWTPWLASMIVPYPLIERGEKAVPVFVVLSGFLVYRACRPTDAAAVRRYLVSRFLRIYPLYITVCLVTFAIAVLTSTGQHYAPEIEPWRLFQYVISQILMLNMVGLQIFPVPQFWSLYVEVSFYLMLPAWVAFFPPSSDRFGHGGHILLLLGVAVLLHVAGFSGPRTLKLWSYFPIGMAASHAYDWLNSRPSGRNRTMIALAVFSLGSILAAFDIAKMLPDIAHGVCLTTSPEILGSTDFAYLGQHLGPGVAVACDTKWSDESVRVLTIWIGLAAAAILVGGANLAAICRVSSLFPARLLAAISYSVFAWHGAVLTLMSVYPNGTGGVFARVNRLPMPAEGFVFLVLVPALLTVSCISYLLIERPALILKSRLTSMSRGR